ncbi:hypothetical protein ES332_D13G051900v1 [Gossypium tomentosum]|uniref:Uncharacterized protein n=1 Tax=Gossypium tomentosum TaxID=34277 RepID=A0A5D2HT23_GOSTO|nr:hypothetical protein ES332_D13G051900v1 [Gossypium tomentosum]
MPLFCIVPILSCMLCDSVVWVGKIDDCVVLPVYSQIWELWRIIRKYWSSGSIAATLEYYSEF